MGRHRLLGIACLAYLAAISVHEAKAQFFLGVPTSSFTTTSGTINNTPTVTVNQVTRELDLSGQLIVQNAVAGVQTTDFTINCALDPAFNSGNPSSIQLQLSQSGFVSVPTGGQIYGWNIQANLIGPPGAIQGSVFATDPNGPYFAGVTTYGPATTTGSVFTYTPSPTAFFQLHFSSNFDGLSASNTYIWDFPLTIKFNPVPEPSSIFLFAAGIGACVVGVRKFRTRRKA